MRVRSAEIVYCNEPSFDADSWWWQIQLDGRVVAESRRMTQVAVEGSGRELAEAMGIDLRVGTEEDVGKSYGPLDVLPPGAYPTGPEVLLLEGTWELVEDGELVAKGWFDDRRSVVEIGRWVAEARKIPFREAAEDDVVRRKAALRRVWEESRADLGVVERRPRSKDLTDLLGDDDG